MLEKIVIRKADISECNILNKMFESLLVYERTHFDKNIKNDLNINSFFDKKINDENYIIFVCLVKEEIVGYISGYIDSDNKIKKEIEVNVESLYICEEHRNKGIGSRLINEFISVCKKLNIRYISIDNFIENDCAKYLYEKLGFKVLKENRRKEI